MGHIRWNLVKQGIHGYPLANKHKIPCMVIKPAVKINQAGLDFCRNAHSTAEGSKQYCMFITVPHAVLQGGEGIGQGEHRLASDILLNPRHQFFNLIKGDIIGQYNPFRNIFNSWVVGLDKGIWSFKPVLNFLKCFRKSRPAGVL